MLTRLRLVEHRRWKERLSGGSADGRQPELPTTAPCQLKQVAGSGAVERQGKRQLLIPLRVIPLRAEFYGTRTWVALSPAKVISSSTRSFLAFTV
jgi:hypothetical protein